MSTQDCALVATRGFRTLTILPPCRRVQTNIPPWIAALNVGAGSMGTILRSEHGFEGPYTVMATGACSVGEDHSMCTQTQARQFELLLYQSELVVSSRGCVCRH